MRLFATVVLISLGMVSGRAEDSVGVSDGNSSQAPAPEQAVGKKELSGISRGTASYDAETIRELYQQYEQQNKRKAEAMPDHLNTEDMELVEFKPIVAEGYRIRNEDQLMQKLDPQPQNRIRRLASLDPELANEILVASRNDQAFMRGENDRQAVSGTGAPATFTAEQLARGMEDALRQIRKALGAKVEEEETSE